MPLPLPAWLSGFLHATRGSAFSWKGIESKTRGKWDGVFDGDGTWKRHQKNSQGDDVGGEGRPILGMMSRCQVSESARGRKQRARRPVVGGGTQAGAARTGVASRPSMTAGLGQGGGQCAGNRRERRRAQEREQGGRRQEAGTQRLSPLCVTPESLWNPWEGKLSVNVRFQRRLCFCAEEGPRLKERQCLKPRPRGQGSDAGEERRGWCGQRGRAGVGEGCGPISGLRCVLYLKHINHRGKVSGVPY